VRQVLRGRLLLTVEEAALIRKLRMLSAQQDIPRVEFVNALKRAVSDERVLAAVQERESS
jgi:hypothetical protein